MKNKLMSNKDIARLLRNVAAAYLLINENRFKVIAYEKAADTVERLTRELKDIWEEGNIHHIPGLGPSISGHLDKYFSTGRAPHFERVLKHIQASVFVLMDIPSIGPKKAYKLVNSLNLKNPKEVIQDLKKAALTDKIASIPSFGEKSQQDILEAIKLYEKNSRAKTIERMPLPYAFSLAQDVQRYLRNLPEVKRVDVLGSSRRKVSTIGDIDIAVMTSSESFKKVIDHFLHFPRTIAIDNAGERKASLIVSPNVRIDLRVLEKEEYGAMLQYFTGSKAHNIKLREYALKKGLSLSEYGIKKARNQKSDIKNIDLNSKIMPFESEKSLYNYLGLQYIPPELREGTNEISLAEKNQIPDLVKLEHIRGDLHTHSSYNLKPSHDLGADTYEEIAQEAKYRNYEYIGFADHNPKISGLTEDEILAIMKKRKEYIVKLFSIQKIDQSKYFIGLETDVLPDGNLALPLRAVEYVDYLIVSVHSSFQMNIKAMTQRVLAALSYPKVKILGHPTGRLIGKREGFELEWEEIFRYAKDKHIALEINSWPERLDLPDTLVRQAINYGVKCVINTDAHAVDQMDTMFYGIAVARRGWCKKSDIMNTLSYTDFRKWILS